MSKLNTVQNCSYEDIDLEANLADAIISDFPYDYLDNKIETGIDWESAIARLTSYCKRDAWLCTTFMGKNRRHLENALANNGWEYVWELNWQKGKASSGVHHIGRTHENILIYRRGRKTLNRVYLPTSQMMKHSMLCGDQIIATIKIIEKILGNKETVEKLLKLHNGDHGWGVDKKGNEYLKTSNYSVSQIDKSTKDRDRELDAVATFIDKAKPTLTRSKNEITTAYRENSNKNRESSISGVDQSQKGRLLQTLIQMPEDSLELVNETGMIYASVPSTIGKKAESCHPTQKPVFLYECLVRLLTRSGDIVLDPFSGSGTTAIASMKLDRKFYGCELHADLAEFANRRIAIEAIGDSGVDSDLFADIDEYMNEYASDDDDEKLF